MTTPSTSSSTTSGTGDGTRSPDSRSQDRAERDQNNDSPAVGHQDVQTTKTSTSHAAATRGATSSVSAPTTNQVRPAPSALRSVAVASTRSGRFGS